MSLQKIALLLTAVYTLGTQAAMEPQAIDPVTDAIFLKQFPNLLNLNVQNSDFFNILIVGQDEPSTNAKLADGRPRLTSRSDIIMVLALDLKRHTSTILTLFRDHEPSRLCEKRMGRPAPDSKINGVYSISGRSAFIPCLEGMLEELIADRGADFSARYLDRGRFNIHALYEMTRNQTLLPLGQAAVNVALENKRQLFGIYGLNLVRALEVFLKPDLVLDALLPAPMPAAVTMDQVNADQLFQDLVGRKGYRAGGYQRAFNSAYGIATVLGWAAYGIEKSRAQNYNFMGRLFGDVIDKHFSRSINFQALENQVLRANGDHQFRHLCFKKGLSPIKIVLWGEDNFTTADFERGKFKFSDNHTDLNALKKIDFLPVPPSCD